jgi:hypothetical protein
MIISKYWLNLSMVHPIFPSDAHSSKPSRQISLDALSNTASLFLKRACHKKHMYSGAHLRIGYPSKPLPVFAQTHPQQHYLSLKAVPPRVYFYPKVQPDFVEQVQ